MNPIVYRITLDLSENGVQYVVSGIKVGDTNRKIEIRLTNNGTPYEIEPGTVAQIRADVGGVNHVDLCEVVGNVISYTVNPNMICREGETIADVELGQYDESGAFQSFATAEIMFLAYEPVVGTGTVPQEYQGSILKAVADATREARNAEAWAGNAETAAYKASNAADKAENAAKYANDAATNAEGQTISSAELTEDFEIRFTKKNGSKILVPGSVRGPEGEPDYSLVAPALKGKKSGNPIAIHDVSPLPHEIKVKLSGSGNGGKNLFHFTEDINESLGEWSHSASKDTSVLVFNGTSSDDYVDGYPILEMDFGTFNLESNKTYTLSIRGDCVGDVGGEFAYLGGNDVHTYEEDDYSFARFTFVPSQLDNLIFTFDFNYFGYADTLYFQLEEGETVTEYEDYVEGVDVNGAVVQRYGLNLFDQETKFKALGFKKQTDGSWLADNKHTPVFTPTAKGQMFFRATAKSTGVHTSYPLILRVNYTDGGRYTEAFSLATNQTEWVHLIGKSDLNRPIANIMYSFGGSVENKETYYIKDVIFSYADAPYEPYTGEQETLTATDGNLSILGNGESMTLIAEDGVTMEADYNRDINKAFAELMEKVEKLGGSV